jgi:hypothetical protein
VKHTYLISLFFLFFLPVLNAQDPDIAENEGDVMEEIFRTSDLEGETAVPKRLRQAKNKRQSVPVGAYRTGCVCMDESASTAHSTGACSGRGGVRYWLYRTREGDTVRVMTARHERHPHPLTATEVSEINQKREVRSAKLASALAPAVAPVMIVPAQPAAPDGGVWLGWSDVAGVGVAGAFLYAIVRMVLNWAERRPDLVRYALRHIIRPRKRPASGKNRKDPPETRV